MLMGSIKRSIRFRKSNAAEMAENTRKHPPLIYRSIRLCSRCFPLFLQENTFKIHVTMVVVFNGVESRQAVSSEMAKERD